MTVNLLVAAPAARGMQICTSITSAPTNTASLTLRLMTNLPAGRCPHSVSTWRPAFASIPARRCLVLRLRPAAVPAERVGRLGAGIEEGERALALDPASAPLYNSLAEAYFLVGKVDLAQTYARRSQAMGIADVN